MQWVGWARRRRDIQILGRSMRVVFALNFVFCMTLASPATGPEVSGAAPDFSESRLREGEEAYAAGRFAEAVNELRIAAFGFLDRPALLCESLVYLALANASAERPAEAKATIERLSEIERRFPACGEAKLDPSVRAQFEGRFHRRLLAFPVATPPKLAPTPRPKAPEPTPRPGG
jgi:hypothetical protein